MAFLSYFRWAFLFTVIGVLLGGGIGWFETGHLAGGLKYFFICGILGILEISLSFDNSIINVRLLEKMSQKWRRRFFTWGIFIAVFGMRIIFPLLVVMFAAGISPVAAIRLAIQEPNQYSEILTSAHVGIAAFGGTFLMMVSLKYFLDSEKGVHWLRAIERPAQKVGAWGGVKVAAVLIVILVFATQVETENKSTFLLSSLYGLLTFMVLEVVSACLDSSKTTANLVARGGVSSFLYLEVLDASFSFDGVIGAFALSHNLLIIAIGLGIGAFYVRSMTLMLSETGILLHYRYLEHGAFYAILMLAMVMYVQTIVPVPEVLAGFTGICIIGAAFYSSIRFNRCTQGK